MRNPPLLYLTAGSVFFLLLGLAVSAGIPALSPPAPTPYSVKYSDLELRGRRIYQREGCWYCHTQQVRSIEVGVGTVQVKGDIGPESTPGDYVSQSPVFWGTNRQGPDLSHVASRPYGGSREWHLDHLRGPQKLNPGTVMPSYAHLPEGELEALAAYLLTLK